MNEPEDIDVAERQKNIQIQIVIDAIRPYHPYGNDVDIEEVLDIELQALEPDTLAAIIDAVGALKKEQKKP